MGEQANGLPLELPTMADKLKEAGYSTHAVGKWHIGFYKKEYTPKYRGFDSYYGNVINNLKMKMRQNLKLYKSRKFSSKSCPAFIKELG